MFDPRRGPESRDIAAAALVAQPFALYLVVLAFLAPPTEDNWARADPILSLLPRGLTVAWVPVASVLIAALWWRLARPDRANLARAGREALLGVGLVCTAVFVVRGVAGPVLPDFIPPEESAGPGFLLSMTAGYSEELLCRLLLLPAILFALRRRLPASVASAVSVVVTALAFSLWHAAGEAEPSTTYFVTRFIIPGVVMSIGFLVSPAGMVVGHSSAHLLIPLVFV